MQLRTPTEIILIQY